VGSYQHVHIAHWSSELFESGTDLGVLSGSLRSPGQYFNPQQELLDQSFQADRSGQ
jgi:hypothetical protein